MASDDPADRTLSTYEEHAEAYARRTPVELPPALARLLGQLAQRLPGGTVLEVGSGPGREADHLEQLGLVVDRTDGAAAFVRQQQERGKRARGLDLRSDDLQHPGGGPYDGVLANAVLLHLDRPTARQVLARAHDATRPGGAPRAHPEGGRRGGVEHRQARGAAVVRLLARARAAGGPRGGGVGGRLAGADGRHRALAGGPRPSAPLTAVPRPGGSRGPWPGR